jgi:hypothetical protein
MEIQSSFEVKSVESQALEKMKNIGTYFESFMESKGILFKPDILNKEINYKISSNDQETYIDSDINKEYPEMINTGNQ